MFRKEMKTIILVLESEVLRKPSHWKLFVAKYLTNYSQDITTRIFLVDVNQQFRSDNFIAKCHYSFEEKASQLNQGNYLPSVSSIINESSINPEDLIVNLSCVSLNELRNYFPNNVIWMFYYQNRPLQSYWHIGEYEIVKKKPTIDIELIQSENGLNVVSIDVIRHNLHYSAVRNFQNAVYTLHLIIVKNIRTNKSSLIYKATDRYRDSCTIKYLLTFYLHIIKQFWGSLLVRMDCNFYGERWTVGISKGYYLEVGIKNIEIHPVPKGEFWADPFLYRNLQDNTLYLFVERFPFKERKGIIACGKVDSQLHIHDMHDILEKSYHLSYPHLIEENGNLYMMPESSANKRLEVYKCDEFPDKWSLFASGLFNQSVTDTVYYKDKNGDRWLFSTISDSDVIMHCTVMNIYKIDSLELKEIIPHKQNPIIIDSSCARNGGRIFEKDGKVFRVAQNNTYGEYGHGISVRQIIKLDINNYEEIEVSRLKGTDIFGYHFNHQMCQIDEAFVVDLRK